MQNNQKQMKNDQSLHSWQFQSLIFQKLSNLVLGYSKNLKKSPKVLFYSKHLKKSPKVLLNQKVT